MPPDLIAVEEFKKHTYSASISGYTPYTTPTDMVVISGIANRKIKINYISISGIQSTAGINTFYLVKRSILDSPGPSAAYTAWSSSTAYSVGDLATLSGTVYQCILANTNNTPPNATTYWSVVGTVYAAYNGATAYVANNYVSYNGTIYICILATTGNLPTNATYWTAVGTIITPIANDSKNPPTSIATIIKYSAIPTTAGTLIGTLISDNLLCPASGSVQNDRIVWGTGQDDVAQEYILNGATEQLCINFGGAAVPGGLSLNINLNWVEGAG